MTLGTACGIVPPYLLKNIADAQARGYAFDPDAAQFSADTLAIDAAFREGRSRPREPAPQRATGGWEVYDAHNGSALPGDLVRGVDGPETGDQAVDEAWAGVQATVKMFAEVYDRKSYDDRDARVISTVHYQKNYDNAFWDGTQLVFGDGDGKIFERFTKPVDVLAHEFTHAVTEHVAGLVYQGQPGALNESVSDVFGSCLKQRVLEQTADQADWLIGAGLFKPQIQGKALRSMSEPGTAYDDPALGKDPQPAHMDDYIETTDDNGGVHLNSGIPNRAFYLSAVAIGGSSAEGAGRIWYSALHHVAADVDFAGFAAATVDAAGKHADAVRSAWHKVGVAVGSGGTPPAPGTPDTPGQPGPGDQDGPVPTPPPPAPGPAPSPTEPAPRGPQGPGSPGAPGQGGDVVEVRRTGGFAGLTVARTLDLGRDDPRASEARALADRLDFAAARRGTPHPDGFVFVFRRGGQEVQVPEQFVTEEERRLVTLVLDDDLES